MNKKKTPNNIEDLLDLNVDFKINKCHSSTDTSRNDNMVTTEVPCKIIQFPNPYVKVDEELEEM